MKKISTGKNIFLFECGISLLFLLLAVKIFSMEKQNTGFLYLPEEIILYILYLAEPPQPISQAETAYWDFIKQNDITYVPPITLFLMYQYYKKMNHPYRLSIDNDSDQIFNKECAFLKLIEEKTIPLIKKYPVKCALKSTCKSMYNCINDLKKDKYDYLSYISQEISISNFFMYAKENNFFEPYILHKSHCLDAEGCFSIASALNEKENRCLRMYFDLKDNTVIVQERSTVYYQYSFKKIWSLFYSYKIKHVLCPLPVMPTEENRLKSAIWLLDFYKKYFNNTSAHALHLFCTNILKPDLCKYDTVRINSRYVQSCGIVKGIQCIIYDTIECKIDLPIPIDIIINLIKAKLYNK